MKKLLILLLFFSFGCDRSEPIEDFEIPEPIETEFEEVTPIEIPTQPVPRRTARPAPTPRVDPPVISNNSVTEEILSPDPVNLQSVQPNTVIERRPLDVPTLPGQPKPYNERVQTCPDGYQFYRAGTYIECIPTCQHAARMAGFSRYTFWSDHVATILRENSNRTIESCHDLNQLDTGFFWGQSGRGWENTRAWQDFQYHDPYTGQTHDNHDVWESMVFINERPGNYAVCCVHGRAVDY